MKFRSEYIASKAPFRLRPESPAVLVGSCFSGNMAAKMREHDWKAGNPLGTLYNPLSIGIALRLMLEPENQALKEFEDSLFMFNGLWNSRWFDSSFSSSHKEDCIKDFQNRRNDFIQKISEGKRLIVTFGTSICYFLEEDLESVGNCHKQPSSLFHTRRLSIEEIFIFWKNLIYQLKEKFPNLKTIFTVSPVRHLKDGFSGNARSKAVLHLAVERICNEIPDCHYFPAYEILTDDLRDYRFYAYDLAHPSEQAVEYIWQKFLDTYLDEEGLKLLEEGAKKVKARSHRPKLGALGKPLKENGGHP